MTPHPTDKQGLYAKFYISRTDGSSEPGGKHEGCAYFVLDLDHDPHAAEAIKAYARSCVEEHPQLASDLLAWLTSSEDRAQLRRRLSDPRENERTPFL